MRSAAGLCAGLFGVTLLAACSTDQLPIGANLTISPESRTYDIQALEDEQGTCLFDEDQYIDVPIVLALTDAQGSPIGKADVKVYVDYTENTVGDLSPVLALYDDRQGNNNGVVDEDELVSDIGDSIAEVKTDRFGGDRALLLRINVSCAYRGQVFERSPTG